MYSLFLAKENETNSSIKIGFNLNFHFPDSLYSYLLVRHFCDGRFSARTMFLRTCLKNVLIEEIQSGGSFLNDLLPEWLGDYYRSTLHSHLQFASLVWPSREYRRRLLLKERHSFFLSGFHLPYVVDAVVVKMFAIASWKRKEEEENAMSPVDMKCSPYWTPSMNYFSRWNVSKAEQQWPLLLSIIVLRAGRS